MEFLKKMVNLGFGALSLTREKVEKMVDDLTKRGELSTEEGKKFVEELLTKIETSKNELESKVESIVEKTLEKLKIPTRSEVDALKTELDKLAKKVKADSAPKKPAKEKE